LPEGKITVTNGVFVRRDITTLSDAEVDSLREGFRVLRQRSANNPNSRLGLLGQANIHRDACAHANWWFLPWHRGYLYYFEQILREAAGDPSLALPYWNWTKNPSLPRRFWGANNPLNDPTRAIAPGTPADAGFVGPGIIREIIVETTDFITFASDQSSAPGIPVAYGVLEGTPHNYIHRFAGGNMRNPDLAARDPIFWLHHANVDRLWTRWVRKHPGQTTTSQSWRQRAFSFFNTQGNPVSITTAQMLNTFDLDYRYDTQRPSAIEGGRAMVAAEFGPDEEPREEPLLQARPAPERRVISSEPVTVTLTPSGRLQERMGERMAMAEDIAEQATTLRLEVQGVAPPGNPNVGVRVFLNMPEADASTPTDDPHYVSSFTFFEHEGDHGEHGHGPKTFYANATPAIRRLQEAGLYELGEPLQATLVTVPIVPEGRVEDVEIPFEGLSISTVD
jgi:tyrosinase